MTIVGCAFSHKMAKSILLLSRAESERGRPTTTKHAVAVPRLGGNGRGQHIRSAMRSPFLGKPP